MLKKLLWIFLFFIIFTSNTSVVSAHVAGQLPFFKVNGVYSELYPVPTTSLPDFGLPQDNSPDVYLINTNIDFELDTSRLPISPEQMKETTFHWDFGDGEKTSGTLNTHHAYQKSGSYILEITAQTKQISEPQLIQSTLINVVPEKPYQLPKSIIKVNGKTANDPLTDIIKLEFGKEIDLDGSGSRQGSGVIVKYFWDLGDGKSESSKRLNYVYKKEQYAYFPVLRITDENGLFADSFVQITNSLNSDGGESNDLNETTRGRYSVKDFLYVIFGGVLILILWGASFPLRKKLLRNKRNS